MPKKTDLSKWGRKGGLARTASLTPEQRRELARAAVQARWRRTALDRARKMIAEAARLQRQAERDQRRLEAAMRAESRTGQRKRPLNTGRKRR